MLKRSRPVVVVLTLTVALLGASCGSSSSDGATGQQEKKEKETEKKDKPLGAAEPADSEKPSVEPAGKVIDLGKDAEGIAYDPVTDLLAVGVRKPDQLVLIQGRTGREVRRIDMPGHVRHLEIGAPGGPLLVPDEDSGRLLVVTLPAGKVTSVKIGKYPHDATQTESGDIVVADELGGKLAVVRDGKVVATFDDPDQPGGVAAIGNVVGMVDVGTFTLSSYDIAANKRLGKVRAGAGPTHLKATDDGRFVVLDTRGDALLVFAGDSLQQEAKIDLPGTPYAITYDGEHDVAWVTLTFENQVVKVDLSGSEPKVTERFGTIQQPNGVAVDPDSGRVWVSGRETGQLQIIDP